MTSAHEIRTRLPDVVENVSLKKYSTFRIGGPARFFIAPSTTDALVEAIRVARSIQLPYVMLGGGSNVLISDNGFPGLIIAARNQSLTFTGNEVEADAGVKLSVLLVSAAQHGLDGLDFLAGVPGTVGGAVYGNAGSRRQAIGDCLTALTILDANGRLQSLDPTDCKFTYRSSRFKQSHEPIVKATLRLPSEESARVLARLTEFIRGKNAKQPTSGQSAGCTFQNVSAAEIETGSSVLRSWITDGQIPAWRLVVEAGLQGKQIGGVRVSERHANYILNDGTGSAEQVVMLISLIKQQVRDRFGVQLHEEIQLIGFEEASAGR